MAVHAQSNIRLNTIPAYTSLLGGHFVYKSSASPSGLTLPSANIIQKLHDNPANWEYNTNIGANGINLRYNEVVLSQWTTNGLTFYLPASSGGVVTQGSKGLEITQSGINFYNPTSHGVDATLDSNGLTLTKGGIKVGTPNSRGFVYLSSEDYPKGSPNGITINGHNPTGETDAAWRQIIGTKFGVDADGVLYAQDAVITGQITIGNHDIDRELNELQEGLDGVITYDHTYVINKDSNDNITSVVFTAHVYRGKVEITNEFNDDRFTWFYKNEDTSTELPVNNNTSNDPQNSGKTITISDSTPIDLSILKYGVEIVGKFNVPDAPALATVDNQALTTNDGNALLSASNATNETVRVRDLTYTTTLSSTDAVLIVTNDSEKLITLDNFAASLNVGVSDVRIGNNSLVTNGIANIPFATSTVDGVMTAADKAKLDSLPTTFQSDVSDVQIDGISIVLNGVADIPVATPTVSGVMSAADKGRLDSLKVIVGGTAITAINRLAYNAENTSLQIFDVDTDIFPSVPSTDGTYHLQVSIVNGEHTYSWV